MKRDIEFWIDKWATLIEANLQTYIDESNTLHPNSPVQLINYEADAFYAMDIPIDQPPYQVFYVLYPSASVTIEPAGQADSALVETVFFDVSIPDDGSSTLFRRGQRYKSLLKRMFNDIILKDNTSCELVSIATNSFVFEDTGQRLQQAGVSWNISIP